ncbi:class D beta-lactamase [Noviherbaspirillum massiliense]|uniref:class D beta-lactamase n=1 Tax=Noviherbaspirillum massiliense TaxID=1465823 RepID=UPI0002F7FE10|nr:class D beta-lactamase [Noviherbaspirillum massiliense]
MQRIIRLLLAMAATGITLFASTANADGVAAKHRVDIAAIFDKAHVQGTFVLLDAQTGHYLRHNRERARTRFLPASTYKIPNSLIALESGVATGPEFALSRNEAVAPRQPWWPAAWNRDHTLRTALKDSVVWYYQELARRIGPERMQSYVDQFGYGNRNISGGIDRFWLTGALRISADEQVDFLRRFYFGKLGVSERTTRIVKDMLVLEETPSYRLSGKTGWAGLGDPSAPQVGWLVGYLEREGQVHFFATNVEIRNNEDAAARLSITKAILHDLGLM